VFVTNIKGRLIFSPETLVSACKLTRRYDSENQQIDVRENQHIDLRDNQHIDLRENLKSHIN
jgi:hypothetical protein